MVRCVYSKPVLTQIKKHPSVCCALVKERRRKEPSLQKRDNYQNTSELSIATRIIAKATREESRGLAAFDMAKVPFCYHKTSRTRRSSKPVSFPRQLGMCHYYCTSTVSFRFQIWPAKPKYISQAFSSCLRSRGPFGVRQNDTEACQIMYD